MPTVSELSDPYANFMRTPPHPHALGVCPVCLTFTHDGYAACYACAHSPNAADAVLAISFSPAMGQLHSALRGYKEGRPGAGRFKLELGGRSLALPQPSRALPRPGGRC